MENKLPDGWEEEKIGNLCNIVTGKKDVNAGSKDGQYPFFTCAQKVYKIKKYVFDDEAILVAGNGFFNVKYYKGKFDAYQRTYVLKDIKINGRYLYRYIQSALADITKNNRGSTIKYIRLGDLANHFVPIPNPEKQKRIADKLDSLLAKVKDAQSRLGRIPLILKQFRQSILASAFSGELTEDWRCENNISNHWQFCCLSDKCDRFQYGTSKKSQKSGDVPVLRMGNLQNGEIDWTSLVYTSNVEEINKFELSKNTVLFNRTNSPELVGKTSIYRGKRKAIFAGYLIRVLVNDALDPEYLNYYLNSSVANQWKNSVKTDGVSQSNINAKKLGNLKMSFPEHEEQKEIVKHIKALFERLEKIEGYYKKVKIHTDKLEQSILAKAFRGELVS